MESQKEVISSLKFIGNIRKGDKINTKFMYRQPDGLITRFIRTFINYDNRQNTLNFVQKTVASAFEIIVILEKSVKQQDRMMRDIIMKDLVTAQVGLNKLKDTYIDDMKFQCDMDTLLQTIACKLSEYQ